MDPSFQNNLCCDINPKKIFKFFKGTPLKFLLKVPKVDDRKRLGILYGFI